MSPERDTKKKEGESKQPPAEPAPPTDTSSDRDEWMEKHADKPRPLPDVADGQGRFRRTDD